MPYLRRLIRRSRAPTGATDARAADLICRYTACVDAELSTGRHAVWSAAGTWLLLATTATAAEGDRLSAIEDLLGTDAHDAARIAGAMLECPHRAVAAGAALWTGRGVAADLDSWSTTLPPALQQGPVPTQRAADAWVADRSKGLITTFPGEISGADPFVLASVVATKTRWEEPFRVVPSSRLEGDWAASVSLVLEAPESHRQLIVSTEHAGDVAVHAATSKAGLMVVSVIAAPDIPAAAVHHGALDVAMLLAGRPSSARRRSLFDLPLDDGHAWEISERHEQMVSPRSDHIERMQTLLPAWRASSTHNLLVASATGMRDLAGALAQLAGLGDPPDVIARQTAVASFGREGFEAAAASVLVARGIPSGATIREVVVREATLRFNRPYAVVAVATDRPGRPWAAVPVFSAWVAQPTDAVL